MNLLASERELRALLAPREVEAYLTEAWDDAERTDLIADEVRLEFDAPARGSLSIKGRYRSGEKNFVIKFVSELQPVNRSDHADSGVFRRKLTLVGDAQTGVITAMLPEGDCGDRQDCRDNTGVDNIPELDWQQIQDCLKAAGDEHVWQLQKDGFKAFSAGEVTIPPVIYMPFEGFGDLHLKGAHKQGGGIYVFKIATAFYRNSERGLLPSQGMMLAFDARTGKPLMVLRDEGHLTDLRTAIAGRIAAETLMPEAELVGIGMLGTGVQARLQLAQLESLYPGCRKLTVWGRTRENTEKYVEEMTGNGWQVSVAASPADVAAAANLIITTTSSQEALLDADDITHSNTLIVTIGADMPGKIEVSAGLLKKAGSLLIDSISQGKDHGNAAEAIKNGEISEEQLQEFGDFLNNGLRDPESANQLRLFLSSGIGVQDLQIVQAVLAGKTN